MKIGVLGAGQLGRMLALAGCGRFLMVPPMGKSESNPLPLSSPLGT